jgi:hypothetical protein
VSNLLLDAHKVLGANSYSEFGTMAGTSKRTVQRWFSGQAAPAAHNYQALARLVHAKSPALAADLAAAGRTTLQALGIVDAAPAAAPPAPPPPPPSDLVVDSLVCAAAEAVELMPAAVRPALLAAFTRARLLGLTVEAVEAGLRARSVRA